LRETPGRAYGVTVLQFPLTELADDVLAFSDPEGETLEMLSRRMKAVEAAQESGDQPTIELPRRPSTARSRHWSRGRVSSQSFRSSASSSSATVRTREVTRVA
jgi:hypothetical protein